MARDSIEISEQAGVRYLHFSSEWVQGAMRVRKPNALELAYTREMMFGLIMRAAPWPRHALLIGLGAGSLAKFIYHKLPKTKITVVEINPQVEIIARLHFKLPDDLARINVVIGDGAEYMLKDGRYFDAILVDGFDKNARSGALDTLPFYQACRNRLTSNGLLAVNLLSHNKGFLASARRISEAFDGRTLTLPPCESGNTIAFATAGDPVTVNAETLSARVAKLNEETGLNLITTLTRLLPKLTTSQNQLNI
jgi:spermidine synthase